jgi:GPH family glycoside/pentoside/hexuronide:cation symporter
MVETTAGGLAKAPASTKPARTTKSADALSNLQLLAFASPALPLAAMVLPIGFLLPPFYTGEMGISLTAWGMIILISRLVDAFTDPFVGMFCDHRPSRWGRRRHWVVISAPLLMVGGAMLLMPSLFGGQSVNFTYLLIGMLVLNLGVTIKGLNTSAWGGELSNDYHERTRIMGWRGAIGAIAPMIAVGIPAVMEHVNPQATTGDKLMAVGWMVLLLTPITTLWSVLAVPERKDAAQTNREKGPSIWASLKVMFTNKILGRLVLARVLETFPTSVKAALYVFFVAFVLQAPHLSATLLLIPFTSLMIGIPFWMRIARGREKHKVIAFANVLLAVIMGCYSLVGPGDILLFCVLTFIAGACSGTDFLARSIMVDIVDTDVAKTGEQRTGTYFAVIETLAKLAPSLAVTVLYPALQLIGFDPTGKANTQQSVDAIKYCYSLLPTIPLLLAAWLMWRFPLGSKEQGELREQIEARRGAATT